MVNVAATQQDGPGLKPTAAYPLWMLVQYASSMMRWRLLPTFHLQPPDTPAEEQSCRDDGWNMISRNHMTGFRAYGSVLQKKTWNILIASKNTTLKAGILRCQTLCAVPVFVQQRKKKTEETKVKAAFSAPQQL